SPCVDRGPEAASRVPARSFWWSRLSGGAAESHAGINGTTIAQAQIPGQCGSPFKLSQRLGNSSRPSYFATTFTAPFPWIFVPSKVWPQRSACVDVGPSSGNVGVKWSKRSTRLSPFTSVNDGAGVDAAELPANSTVKGLTSVALKLVELRIATGTVPVVE